MCKANYREGQAVGQVGRLPEVWMMEPKVLNSLVELPGWTVVLKEVRNESSGGCVEFGDRFTATRE